MTEIKNINDSYAMTELVEIMLARLEEENIEDLEVCITPELLKLIEESLIYKENEI